MRLLSLYTGTPPRLQGERCENRHHDEKELCAEGPTVDLGLGGFIYRQSCLALSGVLSAPQMVRSNVFGAKLREQDARPES